MNLELITDITKAVNGASFEEMEALKARVLNDSSIRQAERFRLRDMLNAISDRLDELAYEGLISYGPDIPATPIDSKWVNSGPLHRLDGPAIENSEGKSFPHWEI